MARQLHEVAGLPVWAWTVSWFAGGVLIGMAFAFACAFFAWRRSATRQRIENSKPRGYAPASPHLSSSVRQDFGIKPDTFSGSIADSIGYGNTDSLSVSHWRGGTRALDPVIESDSIPPSDLVAARLPKHAAADIDKSPETSPSRGEDGMTVQLYPTVPGSARTQASAPESQSKTQSTQGVSDTPQQDSAAGSMGGSSARVTSAGVSVSTSGNGSASGAVPVLRSSMNKAGTGATQHARNVSTVSSTGASPEYEEDDLDDDWRTLLDEVNALLASKNYTPIRNARERATVVNSLLVSTSTRDRSECVRNAAIDMLTFRKMNTTASGKPVHS